MTARENCFFHGVVITIDDKEFASEVQREDNFSGMYARALTKKVLLTHYEICLIRNC